MKKRLSQSQSPAAAEKPFMLGEQVKLFNGDCIEELKKLPDCSVDSVVTDPPYHLTTSAKTNIQTVANTNASAGFMGMQWDGGDIAFRTEIWEQCLRVLKPGGHLLAFSGSRTYHRMACAIEDAGFEVRDQIMWVYSTGFPKSLDISKAIDKSLGAEREIVGHKRGTTTAQDNQSEYSGYRGGVGVKQTTAAVPITKPATVEAEKYDGFGTALKPSHEPIVLARKPLSHGLTVAQNVLKYGTGGINIDGCRVGTEQMTQTVGDGVVKLGNRSMAGGNTGRIVVGVKNGRWPANFIHDGSDEVLELFPDSSGGAYPAKRGKSKIGAFQAGGEGNDNPAPARKMGDSGSAARFFYCAKANKRDRNEGLEGRPKKKSDTRSEKSAGLWHSMNAPHENHHPTVKPTDLMRYLIRLVTPPSGTVLDPFMGSGSTGKAALLENKSFVGVEKQSDYFDLARARITAMFEEINE